MLPEKQSGAAPELPPKGPTHVCAATGGQLVTRDGCISITRVYARNTEFCKGCASPWRICHRCIVQRVNDVSALVTDTEKGLCQFHSKYGESAERSKIAAALLRKKREEEEKEGQERTEEDEIGEDEEIHLALDPVEPADEPSDVDAEEEEEQEKAQEKPEEPTAAEVRNVSPSPKPPLPKPQKPKKPKPQKSPKPPIKREVENKKKAKPPFLWGSEQWKSGKKTTKKWKSKR